MHEKAGQEEFAGRRDCFVQALVEQQARCHPDADAVVSGRTRLSYLELLLGASSVASQLQRLGAGQETVVGLCMERSADWIVGLLGILNAGAVYLPLDTGHPAERLSTMVKRADAVAVLVQRGTADLLADAPTQLIHIDRIPESADVAKPTLSVDSGAYLIYTSGSTGVPRGVLLTHGSLYRFVTWLRENHQVGPGDNVMQLASIGFDASLFEVFLCLTRGAALHIGADEVRLSPVRLRNWMRDSGITVGSLPPILAESLFDLDLTDLSVRLLFTGSDRASRYPPPSAPFRYVNTYGPTESTVFITADPHRYAHNGRPGADRAAPPCGVPIAGAEVYLVDGGLQRVPAGRTGELYLGGAQLARGYLDDPAGTAVRFVPDPFHSTGTRMFRTGDLARWRPDGQLEFVGRIDHQVKIHGMRVELKEIETTLERHPAVRQAVITSDGSPRIRHLTAYLAVSDGLNGRVVSVAELRDYIARTLPHYMQPARYWKVDRWPLTSNGKLDRRALTKGAWEPLDDGREHTTPGTPDEWVVAEAWAVVLGRTCIGREDNFFELGGHSLLAGQAIARIEQALGVRIPIREFFQCRTLAECAAAVRTVKGSGANGSGAADTPLRRELRPATDIPLSFPQRQVWFLQNLHPASAAYNFSAVLHLNGDLDLSALRRSLQFLITRHEIYRTAFRERAGVPYQEIFREIDEPLEIVDLSSTAGDSDEMAARLIGEGARTRFDLTRPPLARWTLFRLDQQRHLLLHVEHHLVHDGWSFHLFLSELVTLYRDHHAGRTPSLAPARTQFADYACWQHRWLGTQEAARQLQYWRAQLADSPASMHLPFDRTRSHVPGFEGYRVHLDLPTQLCRDLRGLGRAEGSTLFAVMLAVFSVLLHRYTGETDLAVGSSVANRHRPGTEQMIGMLVNTQVLRIDLSGEPSFRDVLKRVREVVLDAQANQDLPFERLVAELRPDHDLSHNPLYQVSFNFHDSPRPELRLPDLTVELNDSAGNGTAKFDLTVVAAPRFDQRDGSDEPERQNGLELFFEYAADLFDRPTAERMVGHYQRLLLAAVADPDTAVSRLILVDDEELTPRTALAGEEQPEPNNGQLVPDLVKAWASVTPAAIAVSCGDDRLSYAQLFKAADRLAARLRERGVGPGVVVALCMPRSVDLVAGIVGILRSGGVYQPLDPQLPADRLSFMLHDSGAAVVLVHHDTAELLADNDGPPSVVVGDLPPEPPSSVVDLPRPLAGDPAYVIYTSGSSGRPKGVVVTHGNLAALFRTLLRSPGMRTDQVMSALTTVGFDISLVELLLPLCAGARVAVARDEETFEPVRLAAFLELQRVSTMFATPQVWKGLVESGWHGPGMCAFCGGEPLPATLAAELVDRVASLWNMYGPTETTIMSLLGEVTVEDTTGGSIPLGRPPHGTEVHVLDGGGAPVPVGVVGELFIGGVGVSHGYLGQPEQTAERFVPDWLAGRPGTRLYRTGDLVRRHRGGGIDFVGRTDSQVKLRGHRIELGEIEAVLARQEGVCGALVLLRDAPDGKRLVGYVQPVSDDQNSDHDQLVDRLLGSLRRTLPSYMVPASLHVVSSWPYTPSGKIDRRALPDPDIKPRDAGWVAPRTAAEALVAAVWSDVLGLDVISVNDRFLDIGGHSLIAVQIAARLREILGIDVPVRDIFEHPTVAQLGCAIDWRFPTDLDEHLTDLLSGRDG